MEKCGSKLLFVIIKGLSPHLGSEFRDLQHYVSSLKINDGEPVFEFYLRALKMSQEISLQQDKTGQHNRLIRRFISFLFNVNAFTECTRARMAEITTFFRSPDNHLTQFSKNLQQIYVEDIKNNCAPALIANKAKYVIAPIVAHSWIKNDDTIKKHEETSICDKGQDHNIYTMQEREESMIQ